MQRSSVAAPTGRDVASDPIPGVGFLNTNEAAKFLSLSAKEMERMRRENRGPRWAKLSKKVVRYSVDDLREWVSEHFVANTAQGKALLSREGATA